jgi:hypothetical protein
VRSAAVNLTVPPRYILPASSIKRSGKISISILRLMANTTPFARNLLPDMQERRRGLTSTGKMSMKWVSSCVSATAIVLLLVSCASKVKSPLAIPGFASALDAGWVEVPLPDSRLVPGALIQIFPVDASTVDLRWIGSLEGTCKIAASVLNTTIGDTPKGTKASREFYLDGSVGATLRNWNVTTDAQYASQAILSIKSGSTRSLDVTAFRTWYAVPANRDAVDAACGSALSNKTTYVIQEVYIVSDGTYSFSDDLNPSVAVKPRTSSTVQVEAFADARGRQSGELTIAKPIVFALRRVQRTADGGWASLGGGTTAGDDASPIVDKKIRAILFP